MEQTTGQTEDRRWRAVIVLAVGIAIAYVDRVNLSVALTHIGEAFGVGPAQQGIALSAFFVPYALLQLPAGWIVDRYGIRAPYLFACLLWSAATAAIAFAPSFAWLCVLRALVGVGEALVLPASMHYAYAHFEERARGTVIGVLLVGARVGTAAGLPLAASVMAATNWRTMFIVCGMASVLWLVPFTAWIGGSAARPRPAPASGSRSVPLGAILKSPAIWGTLAGSFCYMYFYYFCLTWMPTYFQREYGLSLEATGWFAGLSFAGTAAMTVIGGRAADLLISRGGDPVRVRKAFTLGGMTLAATQVLSLLSGSPAVMLGATIFALCALGLTTANYWALTQALIPGAAVGRIVGLQNTAVNLAGIASPAMTGWLISTTGSFDAPVAMIGVWLGVGIAAYLFLVKPRFVFTRQ